MAPVRPPRRPGRRFPPRRRVCIFCVEKVDQVDYKETARLRRFLSDSAKIDPRRKSGVCARHQRGLSRAIKRARLIGLLPFTREYARTSPGPQATPGDSVVP